MRSVIGRISAILWLACAAGSGTGQAADNCHGQWVRVGNTAVVLHDDRGNPGNMAVATCDPETNQCTYVDRDGDSWTQEHFAPPGGSDRRTWVHIRGTGKYASEKSAGWYQIGRTVSGQPEGRVAVGTWGGECLY